MTRDEHFWRPSRYEIISHLWIRSEDCHYSPFQLYDASLGASAVEKNFVEKEEKIQKGYETTRYAIQRLSKTTDHEMRDCYLRIKLFKMAQKNAQDTQDYELHPNVERKNVIIVSSMWYVLRFEHAHVLKLIQWRPVVLEIQLMVPFTIFHSYNFYCRFPENDCSFDGLLTLLRKCLCI